MYDGGRPLDGLDKVWFDGVLEQDGLRPGGLQVTAINWLSLDGEANHGVAQHLLELAWVVAQAEYGHDLRRSRDVELRLVYHATILPPEADDYPPQRAVVHVHDPRPLYPPGIQTQCVIVVHAVVYQGGEEVVGRRNG